MAHAGEVVGPPSVWGAVDVLDVERLGHGIRTIDDPALVAHLRARHIALDVCPTSNLRTGAVADVGSHPLRKLYDAGLLVTLNSDDPIFFGTSLTEEYRQAVKSFGFNVDELIALVMNGVRATFLPPSERQALISSMNEEIDTLRAELDL
jgi:adenosine deaminase